MPTYEYACKACGKHVEAVQSFSDPALTTCPACGGELRKIFGNVGIVFKGSGFYKTDSRPTDGSKKASSTSSGGKESHEVSASSSEAKDASSSGSESAAKPAASATTPAPSAAS